MYYYIVFNIQEKKTCKTVKGDMLDKQILKGASVAFEYLNKESVFVHMLQVFLLYR